ncbi:Transposase IS66 family protein [Anoxynatronum buryatiense]|uniref:Transposase IS66 family protein n=2 Tax=Anoxynatronum buryatiense TaxID=489973 RepID=A0AA45WYA0_9CLOT|nr:transposase [Anoxynatronum buryatiense]SMP68093.1 Transposase IS66 family protein [Anoxynatronum buryatiense]
MFHQTTRASKHPAAFLKGFKGYLHTDGYQGYNQISGVRVIGCWVHAQRMFTNALKVLTKEKEPLSHTRSAEGLAFCNRLFELESELKDLSPQERYTAHLEQSRPVTEAFLARLKENKRPPSPNHLWEKPSLTA